MSQQIKVDVCVIGAGSGGLSVAAGAAQMGASVALVEKGEMGGDCLNTGCVPSKSMLAAAHARHAVETADRFGIRVGDVSTDWGGVHTHVRSVIAAIAPHDSQQRFEDLGVQVIRSAGRFLDRHTLGAGNALIHAKYFVVATGSSPFVPPIPGLDGATYFTNETIFDNKEAIEHLLVIGGGPIGMELAQAHRRLGARVSVLEAARLLPKDDPELTRVVIDALVGEGVTFYEGIGDLALAKADSGIHARFSQGGKERGLVASHVLVATGRRANVDGLNLEAAGVAYSPRGIEVDARLRSTNRRVFAVGDVAGPYQFTHMAAYQAGIVIRNMLFKLPAKVDYSAVPWVTYTDPELAQVGMSEADAKAAGHDISVLRWPFVENDRAQAERRSQGLVKVVVTAKGRILGAGIAGLHAGELIQPWILAIDRGMRIGALANIIAPYPTLGEANKRAAGSFYTPKLFTPRIRKLVRLLMRIS